VKGFCGDGRAVLHPNSDPDTEQILRMKGFPGSGGFSLSGSSIVSGSQMGGAFNVQQVQCVLRGRGALGA
jgi:hypothetical protein